MSKTSPGRTKQPKNQKSPQKGRLVRYADFTDIGQIKDETTYDNNSKEALALQKIEQPPEYGAFGIEGFGTRRYTEGSSEVFEWEFGESAIAVTDALTGSFIEERFGDETGRIGTNSYFRHVIEGKFKYSKKGNLTNANVTGFAIWQHHRGDGDAVMYTKFDTPVALSASSFQEFTNRITAEQAKTATSNNGHTYFYEADPGFETVGILSDFSSYTISKYFDSNWWSNPFATNIVQ